MQFMFVGLIVVTGCDFSTFLLDGINDNYGNDNNDFCITKSHYSQLFFLYESLDDVHIGVANYGALGHVLSLIHI